MGLASANPMRKRASRPSLCVPVGWMASMPPPQLTVLLSSPSLRLSVGRHVFLRCYASCWPLGHAPCLLRECCAASSPPHSLTPRRQLPGTTAMPCKCGCAMDPSSSGTGGHVLSCPSCMCDRTPGHGLDVNAVASMVRHASKHVP